MLCLILAAVIVMQNDSSVVLHILLLNVQSTAPKTASTDMQEYGEETEGHSVLQEYLKNK